MYMITKKKRYVVKSSADVLKSVDSFCNYYRLIKEYIEKGKIRSSLDRGAFALPQFILKGKFLSLLGSGRNSMSYAYGPEMGDIHIRTKIIDLENARYQTSYSPDHVAVVPGAWSGVEFVIEELVNLKKGKTRPMTLAVIGPTHYQMFHRAINVYGVNVVGYDFIFPGEGSTPRTKQEIDEILASRPSAVFLANPNNPNGEYFPPEILRYLIQTAQKRKIYVIVDEIQDFLSAKDKGLRYGKWIQSANVIRVDSFSKKRGISEYRIGWVIAPKEILGDRLCGVIGRMSGLMGNAPRAANTAIAAILDADLQRVYTGKNAFGPVERSLRKREDAIHKRLAKMHGVEILPREACINITIKVRAPYTDMQLAKKLMDEGTLIMPCAGYGYDPKDGVMRITFAERWKKIDHSMSALSRVLR